MRLRKMRFLGLLMIILLLSGCRQQSSYDLQAAECAAVLAEKIPFADTLSPLSKEMGLVLYPVAAEDVAEHSIYVSTGATAEEIAVFAAVDSEAAERVKSAVLQRVEEQKASYAAYRPAELPKLEEPYLQVAGSYVIFCVSDHNDQVNKIVEQLLYGKEER
ncbi:MAG TPA: hypothetical protein DCE00_03960 [Firmicutes bacterium]|jgi:hypothetical protein|nr:hypothetical protein [Bacillota bacterium]